MADETHNPPIIRENQAPEQMFCALRLANHYQIDRHSYSAIGALRRSATGMEDPLHHTARDDVILVEFLAPDLVAGQATTAFRFFELLHLGIHGMPGLPPGGVAELQELRERAVGSRGTVERSMRDDLGLAGYHPQRSPGRHRPTRRPPLKPHRAE